MKKLLSILKFDERVLTFLWKYSDEIGRATLAIIFIWFGWLKVVALSPAAGLLGILLDSTFLSIIPYDIFLVTFGLVEVAIGVLFLIPKMERIAILFLLIHMVTTILPLFMLPEVAWQSPLIPTLEGQYMLKNVALIALALGIGSHLHPLKESFKNN
jgi:uncharacterized membrane protein YkgB